jgi:hypothetical protein
MKSETRWFVLPRFGSCKPTPRWGGHKDRVSFNPLPLSNDHLDRVSFSSQSIGTLSPYKDHHTIGVSCLYYNWVGNKKERRRKAIQAQELKWTQMSLSLVTISLEWPLDLGEDLISCLCLGVKSRALVLNANSWNLDALKCWWLGVFIDPTTKVVVGKAVCRMAHQTVRCATGQSDAPPDIVRCASHVTQPLGFDRWSSDMWGHRTVRWCTGQSLL